MRRGGRLPERLTARGLAGRMKLTFAVHRDSLASFPGRVGGEKTSSLLPRGLGKRLRDSLAITHGYVLQLPNCIKASREASLRGQPRMH